MRIQKVDMDGVGFIVAALKATIFSVLLVNNKKKKSEQNTCKEHSIFNAGEFKVVISIEKAACLYSTYCMLTSIAIINCRSIS